MAYRIIVQDAAVEDAREYAVYILEGSNRWLDKLESVIRTLAEMPNRFKLIEEQEDFDIALRQIIHVSHRVIYHVSEESKQCTC